MSNLNINPNACQQNVQYLLAVQRQQQRELDILKGLLKESRRNEADMEEKNKRLEIQVRNRDAQMEERAMASNKALNTANSRIHNLNSELDRVYKELRAARDALPLVGSCDETSFVIRRRFDMGYHQAKDIVDSLETRNVPFLDKDAYMKRVIFGFDGHAIPPRTCFVSGLPQKGVGDHIRPMRANRNITACYGGNSKWNLVPVISSLNQPYKYIVLLHEGTFVKVSLDSTTMYLTTTLPDDFFVSFYEHYKKLRASLEDQTFRVEEKLKGYHVDPSNMKLYTNANIVLHLDDFRDKIARRCRVRQDEPSMVDVMMAMPNTAKRTKDGKNAFVDTLMGIPELLNIIKEKDNIVNKELLLYMFSEKYTNLFDPAKTLTMVYYEFAEYYLNIDMRVFQACDAARHYRWMQEKQAHGLYAKADALDICMKLELWSLYVRSQNRDGKVPKMEWQMDESALKRIESCLTDGVRYIHEQTQDIIQDLVSNPL